MRKQLPLFDLGPMKKAFGGSSLGKGNPREGRFVSTKDPMHLVLRSSLATGKRSLLAQDRAIGRIVMAQAKRCGIKIHKWVNAGNHLHLLVQVPHRSRLNAFLRAVSGLVARVVLKAEKGRAFFGFEEARKAAREESSRSETEARTPARFWDFRPFSRVVSWGRDFKQVQNYLQLNSVEIDLGLGRKGARELLETERELKKRRAQAASLKLLPLGFS
jgi:REP element-mobilizing transposase RayT